MVIEVDNAGFPVLPPFTDPETLGLYRSGDGGLPAQRSRRDGMSIQPLLENSAHMDFKTALIDAFTCYLSSCLVWRETKIFSQGLFLFSDGSICLEKRVLFNMLFDTVASEAIWHVTVTCSSQQASPSKPNQRFPHSFFILFELQC